MVVRGHRSLAGKRALIGRCLSFLAGKQLLAGQHLKLLAGKELWSIDPRVCLPARPDGRWRPAGANRPSHGALELQNGVGGALVENHECALTFI